MRTLGFPANPGKGKLMHNAVEEYLTSEKAAAILDVTPQMIRKLCHAGQLPHYRVGRCIRIAREDFQNYLACRRVGREAVNPNSPGPCRGH